MPIAHQQLSTPLQYTDNVPGVMAWLDAAVHHLNTQSVLHHRVSLVDLAAFLSAVTPPPPSLQERWTTMVWRRPGEPFILYMLRCLSHHYALTRMSPHVELQTTSSRQKSPYAEADVTALLRDTALELEVCRVVGLRVQPCVAELVQSGWCARRCSTCHDQQQNQCFEQPSLLLPLQYGGGTCSTCGGSFPIVPSWARRYSFVLQRQDGSRVAAIAFGDAVGLQLRLGAPLLMLMYSTAAATTQTHKQSMPPPDKSKPLWVVHSAEAVQVYTAHPASSLQFMARGSASNMRRASLSQLGRLMAPLVQGQGRAKELLFLFTLHALYRALRAPHWPPMNLLLVGPAKCGKSALLRVVSNLLGSHGAMVAGSVVHGAAAGKKSFESVLPGLTGDVLLCGAALEAAAIVVDDIAPMCAAQTGCLTLQEMMDCHHCTAAAVPSRAVGEAAVFPTAAEMVASVDEEKKNVVLVAESFTLVARVSPQLSLAHTATIGQELVEASVARSASSRCSTPPVRSQSRCDTPDGIVGDIILDTETLIHAVSQAPHPEDINTQLAPHIIPFFLAKLHQHMCLLEAATATFGVSLPPHASTRGAVGVVPKAIPCTASLDKHLRALCCLASARAVLALPSLSLPVYHQEGAIAADAWLLIAEDVWGVYETHLRSMSHLIDVSKTAPSSAITAGAALPTGSDPCMMDAAGDLSARVRHGSKRQRTSKKAAKLRLWQLMKDEWQRGGSSSSCPGGVVSASRAKELFLRLGGEGAMGDPLDVVLSQLQHEGLMICRPGGWSMTA